MDIAHPDCQVSKLVPNTCSGTFFLLIRCFPSYKNVFVEKMRNALFWYQQSICFLQNGYSSGDTQPYSTSMLSPSIIYSTHYYYYFYRYSKAI